MRQHFLGQLLDDVGGRPPCELDAERGAVKRLQARLHETQAAAQQQLAQARKALAEEQEQRRLAEQGAQALRAEAQENRTRLEAELAAIRAGTAAARERELAQEARLAAAEARSEDLLAQLKAKDGQLGEMARHLMALSAGVAARDAADQALKGAS